jgi:hypothetical protein
MNRLGVEMQSHDVPLAAGEQIAFAIVPGIRHLKKRSPSSCLFSKFPA